MKIQYASDLHLELSRNSRWLKNNPLNVTGNILVLAGDIDYLGTDCTNNPFWSLCADNYEQTLIVPGNHEYYGGFDLKDTLLEWHFELRGNVRYLNNTVVKIGRICIVLSTLWSNVRAENALVIENGITDFHRIRYGENGLDFTMFNEAHRCSLDFIRNAVSLHANDNIIVVSHHLPSQILVSDRFKGSKLNDAFSSVQGQWIADSKISHWIYGHSHTNISGKIGNTDFLSNQLGYVYDVPEAVDFNNGAYIKVS